MAKFLDVSVAIGMERGAQAGLAVLRRDVRALPPMPSGPVGRAPNGGGAGVPSRAPAVVGNERERAFLRRRLAAVEIRRLD
ncbi:hypothetical protein ACGFNU_32275 [Spirillospora sp. NPDC048911]|uniref:hypothetical protein n=1 Tax=Spirillospora sp. NPDC048911 TaxID=3364527 RepID=UPI00371A84CE